MPQDTQKMLSEEEAKLSQEYQDYQKKLDLQKEEYRRYIIIHFQNTIIVHVIRILRKT